MTSSVMEKKKYKTTQLQFRVSERQKAAYEKTAEAQEKATSEWVREVLDAAVREFKSID